MKHVYISRGIYKNQMILFNIYIKKCLEISSTAQLFDHKITDSKFIDKWFSTSFKINANNDVSYEQLVTNHKYSYRKTVITQIIHTAISSHVCCLHFSNFCKINITPWIQITVPLSVHYFYRSLS